MSVAAGRYKRGVAVSTATEFPVCDALLIKGTIDVTQITTKNGDTIADPINVTGTTMILPISCKQATFTGAGVVSALYEA